MAICRSEQLGACTAGGAPEERAGGGQQASQPPAAERAEQTPHSANLGGGPKRSLFFFFSPEPPGKPAGPNGHTRRTASFQTPSGRRRPIGRRLPEGVWNEAVRLVWPLGPAGFPGGSGEKKKKRERFGPPPKFAECGVCSARSAAGGWLACCPPPARSSGAPPAVQAPSCSERQIANLAAGPRDGILPFGSRPPSHDLLL